MAYPCTVTTSERSSSGGRNESSGSSSHGRQQNGNGSTGVGYPNSGSNQGRGSNNGQSQGQYFRYPRDGQYGAHDQYGNANSYGQKSYGRAEYRGGHRGGQQRGKTWENQHGSTDWRNESWEEQGNSQWDDQGGYYNWRGQGGPPYRQNSSGGYRNDPPDVVLSKTLSSILRHNADKFNLNLLQGGFIYVDEILHKVPKLRNYTQEDVKRVVDSNDKQRFALQPHRESGRLMIRANQGHTMQVDDLDLKPLLSPDNVPCAIHGTYYESWEAIKRTGLSRMQRNHIHMAMGEPGREGVISGMRSSCEVTIRVDLKKAMDDGIKFFVSANNVILSPGNEDGLIPPKYFELVMDRKKGAKIAVDLPIAKQADNQTEKKKKKKKRSKKGKEEKSDDEQTPDTWEEKAKNEMPSSSPQETADSVTNRKRAAPPDQPVATSPPQKGHLESEPKQVTKTSQETVPDVPITTKVQASPAKLADQPWREPVTIDDVEVSKCSMDDVISKSGDHNDITVMCCGEKFGSRESKLRLLALFSRPNIYIYHLNDENHELLQEGDVLKVLRSKSVTKVLHNVKETSHGLLREYDVLLDGSPIWDIALMFEKVTLTKVELELLKEEFEFTPRSFKSWAVENEDWASKLTPEVVEKVVRRGKLIDKLYSLCMSHIHTPEVTKKIKSAVYAAANPSEAEDKELYEKYKELTKERQAKEKAEKNASKPEAPKQQQSQPNKKSGKGNKKKK
ncbi:uncharacterized protein LOC127871281 isoform X5 [Dreissena polymorpha]|uniref:uncharacterized protein LOC127871281 isoform X5 n=1 Tax=Dreissena polymorpha TaxID=45954 RepID=UPI0022656423|nr:uncharacterized protein LOC127871281 isoform X5 [Dreissena polymorpha]